LKGSTQSARSNSYFRTCVCLLHRSLQNAQGRFLFEGGVYFFIWTFSSSNR